MQIWQSAASLSENANCIQFPAQNTETHSTPKGLAYHATSCLSDHLSVKKRVWPWGKPTSSPGIDQQRSSSPQTRRKPKIHFSSIAVSANSRSRWSAPWARTTADLLNMITVHMNAGAGRTRLFVCNQQVGLTSTGIIRVLRHGSQPITQQRGRPVRPAIIPIRWMKLYWITDPGKHQPCGLPHKLSPDAWNASYQTGS